MRTPLYKQVFSVFVFSVLVGTLIMLLIDFQSFTSWAGIQKVWPSVLMSIAYTFALSEGNGYLDSYLDHFAKWIDQPVKRLILSIVVMFVYTTLTILLIEWLAAKLIWEARCNCALTWSGYYLRNMTFPLLITVIITTFLNSRKFLLEWRRSAIEAERLRSAHLASQYQSLKDQVNPHFLFNSLNTLTYLVYENQDQAAQFVGKLSEVYRYVLDTRDREVVPLSEELTFVRSYVFLQQIRFENALQVALEVPEAAQYYIPPLALQMLLENAVKHNEISEEAPLTLTIGTEENRWLVVKNNRQPKASQASSSGIGLNNIQARYAYLTKEEVMVTDDHQHFVVKLPLLRKAVTKLSSEALPSSATHF